MNESLNRCFELVERAFSRKWVRLLHFAIVLLFTMRV